MPDSSQRRVRVGMVGGAPGAGIAETHRTAMRIDDRYDLVAGVFSRDREKSLAAARKLRLGEDRVYSDYSTMAEAECKRQDGIDAAIIVTPTDSPFLRRKSMSSATSRFASRSPKPARFVTGLEVAEVAAELSQIVTGRAIKDNANLLLRFSNGARGTLWASMAAVGNEHGLRIRVYGDSGSLAWHHEDPHHLRYFPIDSPPQILAHGADWLSPDAAKWTRAGLGHPEGFFEASANLYTEVADALLAKAGGKAYAKSELGFPDASDGLHGVAFVEGAMRSYAAGGAWAALESN